VNLSVEGGQLPIWSAIKPAKRTAAFIAVANFVGFGPFRHQLFYLPDEPSRFRNTFLEAEGVSAFYFRATMRGGAAARRHTTSAW
jgi:hypothetical protein